MCVCACLSVRMRVGEREGMIDRKREKERESRLVKYFCPHEWEYCIPQDTILPFIISLITHTLVQNYFYDAHK